MTERIYTSKTPCVGLCSTVYGDVVCRGCKRFSDEIIDWNRFDYGQKSAVWKRLEQFLSQIVMTRIEVVSTVQLCEGLAARHMTVVMEQPLAFQVWRLLCRADAPALAECGLRVQPDYAHIPLRLLLDEIDKLYFELSHVYYQRHTVRANL
tara:strand:- start:6591 stop:7043 length:453 start_codon:yes stop_codon:yes gene_type:complete